MKVQTEEWCRFIPGVRMWKGKMTLFYNGEKLFDFESREYLVYSKEERDSWEVIVLLPGNEVIPEWTFKFCMNVKFVIMANTVRRIEFAAFSHCTSLVYIQLSRNLEYIGDLVFHFCTSLTPIFIPPSCTWIGGWAFQGCFKLIILSVSQNTQLGDDVIANTALIRASPFPTENQEEVKQWIKNINQGEIYSLHRACSTLNPPLENDIIATMRRQGLGALRALNSIGLTPLQYLEANPYANIDQKSIMKKFILETMGEVVE
ncbi:hypothetical protein CTEN210_14878 [Chaetoceros tenuissimus]|uniref:Leucine-rich repeat domain-containing protein n=1 Tax=Chaetoceros tenuissimus TaxID=426638 RepID=A0AAD3D6J4_9STRA|nr:hypothetical protein CTEN210_14878 [Chaetoceros tenuissimus]